MQTSSLKKLAQKCKLGAAALLTLDTESKNGTLRAMAAELRALSRAIIKANRQDIKAAQRSGLQRHLIDRLLLNDQRIDDMARGLEEVANLPDPVGETVSQWVRPNGLKVERVRIPLGVIGVIYESRPNVTVDAAGLCFKSGNAVFLRGGSEAIHSNKMLGRILQEVLKKKGIPPEAITVVPVTDRALLKAMLKLDGLIDLIIPRGGEGLMKFVAEHTRIPVVRHDKGICSIFVDESADFDMAVSIVENAKVSRPGVCNAAENLFVHEKIASSFLPRLVERLKKDGVEIRGDRKTASIVKGIKRATAKDWTTEYLDLILSIGVVNDIDEAIGLIRHYGSNHTEAIVTKDRANAGKFVKSLDSSCVMVNASTRFNDGGQLGLGAEIGISTTKVHAFGPMGLAELTTTKFVVHGEGQIRS
ncbi:MAG: glutamate-5-semialdehyde dehydrogenase [Deltaproteobacteria bacterium]|nr:glutamate-5-semialdehyde dehydrogenase [Deltaproteobacteria bacterium]